MKTIAKLVCCGAALIWGQGAIAAGVAVSEPAGAIVLELAAAPPDVAASAPAAQPDQGVQQATRVPVQANYDKVDRARIEKRIADRAARTKKRTLDAEKNAAARAADAPQ